MINGLSLFSGYAGIDIALSEWVRPIMYCEIEPYAQGILLSRMDDETIPFAPVWNDVTTIDGSKLNGLVDIIYGGFPCQDISVAGKGAGLEGKRSGLFYEIIRICKEASPLFIFLENVPAIRTRGAIEVAEALASIGYDCRWHHLSAAEVGANHKRERWFLLAHSNGATIRQRQQKEDGRSHCGDEKEHLPEYLRENMANSMLERLERQRQEPVGVKQKHAHACESSWWQTEPELGGVFNGFTEWLDEDKEAIYQSGERIALYASETETSPREVLRSLHDYFNSQEIWEATRGYDGISQETLLQSYLQRIQEGVTDEAWLQLESKEASREELRSMWIRPEIDCPSFGSANRKQSGGKHSNPLQALSRLLAYDREEAWAKYCRENALVTGEVGLSRIAYETPYRPHRIKALGNGVVPLQVKTAFEILMGVRK